MGVIFVNSVRYLDPNQPVGLYMILPGIAQCFNSHRGASALDDTHSRVADRSLGPLTRPVGRTKRLVWDRQPPVHQDQFASVKVAANTKQLARSETTSARGHFRSGGVARTHGRTLTSNAQMTEPNTMVSGR